MNYCTNKNRLFQFEFVGTTAEIFIYDSHVNAYYVTYSHIGILHATWFLLSGFVFFSTFKTLLASYSQISLRFISHKILFRLGCYSAYLYLQQISLWIRLLFFDNCCVLTPVAYSCCSNRRQIRVDEQHSDWNIFISNFPDSFICQMF